MLIERFASTVPVLAAVQFVLPYPICTDYVMSDSAQSISMDEQFNFFAEIPSNSWTVFTLLGAGAVVEGNQAVARKYGTTG